MVKTELFVNHRKAPAVEHASLFECAEAIGVRVPTSCLKRGKCRECLLEIESGMEHLSRRTAEEEHLGEGFRLACRTRIERDGVVRCHTMRRGAMRIVDEASGLSETSVEPRAGRGIALDVGTTTVALRLYDLESGRLMSTQSFENPQRFGGSDIMARIHYDTSHAGRLLQRTLLGYLRQAIDGLGVASESIVEMVVAGNTTMRDLFFGLDVYPIGQKPYKSTNERSLAVAAKKLRLPFHPDAVVYGLPIIGSHVGADAAAALLATGLHESESVGLLMDIGTNTELILGNRDRVVAASCPAGPAFEGGGVACGMPALDGAIERVALNGSGAPKTLVIGGGKPEGICGSGLVDLMSELLRTQRMNEQGRFAEELSPFEVAEGIVFTESDMNELAQAKGANVAGLQIVLDVCGLGFDDIDEFYLAGGFAKHLDIEAAQRIGLIPDIAAEKIVRVGNAALEGASKALLAPSLRRALDDVVTEIEHIELETHPDFFEFFVEGCQFQRMRAN
jgi:uncharacterized 2Fe-2S/4Fe-4S cluster protein (DUF4445 family)